MLTRRALNVLRFPKTSFALALLASAARAQNAESELSLTDLLSSVQVVSASKTLESVNTAPSTIYVITEREIRRNGWYTLQDALENVPGLQAVNNDFFMVGGQRGQSGNFAKSLLLVNGREMQNLFAGETFINQQFATHNVSRIEIIQGPGSALYGANALTGVINILTKSDAKDFKGTEVHAEAGSQASRAYGVVFGQQLGDLRVSGSLRAQQSARWDFGAFANSPEFWGGTERLRAGVLSPGSNEYRNRTTSLPLSAKLEYGGFYVGHESYQVRSANKGLETVQLNYNGANDDVRDLRLYYAGIDRSLGEHLAVNVEYQHFYETFAGHNYKAGTNEAFWTANPGRTTPLTRREVVENFGEYYGNASSDGSTRDRGTVQLTATIPLEKGEIVSSDLSIIAGYDYDEKNVKGVLVSAAGNGGYFDANPAFEDPAFLASTYPRRDNRSHKQSAYVQAKQAYLGNSLFLTLGGRYVKPEQYKSTFNARSGLVWNPVEGTYLKALFGQAFREPTIFEIYGLKPGQTLEPERVNTYELGFVQDFGPNVQGSLVAYENILTAAATNQDLINFKQAGKDNKDAVLGLEFQLMTKFHALTLSGNYGLTVPQDAESYAGKDHVGLGIYKHRANLSASYDLPRNLTLGLTLQHYGAIDAKHGNSDVAEVLHFQPATKLNLTLSSLGWKVSDGSELRLQATVMNLLDTTWYQPNVRTSGPKKFQEPGRQYLARVTLGF